MCTVCAVAIRWIQGDTYASPNSHHTKAEWFSIGCTGIPSLRPPETMAQTGHITGYSQAIRFSQINEHMNHQGVMLTCLVSHTETNFVHTRFSGNQDLSHQPSTQAPSAHLESPATLPAWPGCVLCFRPPQLLSAPPSKRPPHRG